MTEHATISVSAAETDIPAAEIHVSAAETSVSGAETKFAAMKTTQLLRHPSCSSTSMYAAEVAHQAHVFSMTTGYE